MWGSLSQGDETLSQGDEISLELVCSDWMRLSSFPRGEGQPGVSTIKNRPVGAYTLRKRCELCFPKRQSVTFETGVGLWDPVISEWKGCSLSPFVWVHVFFPSRPLVVQFTHNVEVGERHDWPVGNHQQVTDHSCILCIVWEQIIIAFYMVHRRAFSI